MTNPGAPERRLQGEHPAVIYTRRFAPVDIRLAG